MRHLNKFVPVTQPQTLVGFLKSIGGLRDCTEMRVRDARQVWPGLVNNKRGRSLDHARESAQEAGYLGDFSSVSDLLDAIDAHPCYRPADLGQLDAWREQSRLAAYAESHIDAVAPCAIEDAMAEFDALVTECTTGAPHDVDPRDMKDRERGAKALAWRLSLGLSRAKLAEAIGFAPSLIQDYEEGGRRGKSAAHTAISPDAWRKYERACAAHGASLPTLF
jgi:hypothetical protein